jgi:hypothetical protein
MISPSNPRTSRRRVLTGAAVVAAAIFATIPAAAQAITIPVACANGENALVGAVNLANSTPAADTLALAGGCTYTLTSGHGSAGNGPTGLPVITTPIEMIGPATITRSPGLLGDILNPFRIAEVSSTGALTLTTSVTLSNGRAASGLLGLGAQSGGGILNRGAVTLTSSTLTNNVATAKGGGLANTDTPTGTAPAATFTTSGVSGNRAAGDGGGIYNGLRGTLTVTSTPVNATNRSGARGGGIAAVSSTATTITTSAISGNIAGTTAGGVFRSGGTMTTNQSPITANTPNNCVGSVPAVPNCTG